MKGPTILADQALLSQLRGFQDPNPASFVELGVTTEEDHLVQGNRRVRRVQPVDRAVKLINPPGLRIKGADLKPENRELRQRILEADPEQASGIKVSEALRHLEAQEAKGNVVQTPSGPVKGPDFEAHQLPEINAILYNFPAPDLSIPPEER